MTRPCGSGNRLLAALPPRTLICWRPNSRGRARSRRGPLAAGDQIEHGCFLIAAPSLMIDMRTADGCHRRSRGEGAPFERAQIRPSPSAHRLRSVRGHPLSDPASRFSARLSPERRDPAAVGTPGRAVQFQLGVACSALHPVKARMARWLLHFRDHVDHDVLPLTQEALSQILGVRRTTVTLLMRNLRASGAIRSDRRGQIEVDRSRLAAAACECHGAMHLEVEEIFSMNTARSRGLAVAASAIAESGDAM